MGIVVVVGILGLIIGSFLNVVILRHKERGLGGRSGCMSCGHQLTVQDLIPVISWLYLWGNCRSCGSRISIQYPLVESLTAIGFAMTAYALDIQWMGDMYTVSKIILLVLGLGIIVWSVIISTYDIRHTIIPNEWSYGFFATALLYVYIAEGYSTHALLYAFVSGIVCALPFGLLWFVSRGRWMGLGDAKLALGIGALLGVVQGFISIVIACWIGTLVSLTVLIVLPTILSPSVRRLLHLRRPMTLKSEIPFGPYLILGCILVWWVSFFGHPFDILGLPL